MAEPDYSTWSLKRLAWAYGCAKKGEEPEALLRALRNKAAVRPHPWERRCLRHLPGGGRCGYCAPCRKHG